MYQYQLLSKCLHGLKKLAILCSSAFVVLTASTMVELPHSKVLAQEEVVSQSLEAASLFQQGVMRYNRNDLPAAEYAFRQALEQDPQLGKARNYLGNIMLQQNHLDLAAQEYGEAIRVNPNLVQAYYNLGVVLQKQGKPEAAMSAYRQALVTDPTMASAQYNLGVILHQQGQIPEAIAAYKQAVNLDKKNDKAYFNLAIAFQQQGELEQAITAYRQAIQNNPKNAVAYNNLGSLLVVQEKTKDAIATYQEVIRRLPNDTTAYYNLGVTLYNQGEFQQANKLLKHAQKKYQEQGNIQKTEKIGQIIEYIAYIQKQPSLPETTTANLPENSAPENKPTEKSIPVTQPQVVEFSVEQQQPELTPNTPEASIEASANSANN
ncbi:MAG: tetratricopeptide repeat protein [Calothrix sp. MO_167.B42]|nr:tetratricopeptide repeat protein [Calothrix sp. MO_167.B42]